MLEYHNPKDRVQATSWFGKKDSLDELDKLKFAFSALVEMITSPGSYERETARNACEGVRRRIDYLHDSLRRQLDA